MESRPNPYSTADELLHDFRVGEELALKVIYDLHYHSLLAYSLRFTKDSAASEDIIVESILKLWDKRMQMESIKGMIAYLHAIVKNSSLIFLQKNARLSKAHQHAFYLSDHIHKEADSEEVRATLIQLILLETSNMPAQMQQVFRMAYLEGKLAPSIAKSMNLSVHTVQTHKKLAMKRLRKVLSLKGFDRWSYIFLLFSNALMKLISG